jgi:hypothetical protein
MAGDEKIFADQRGGDNAGQKTGSSNVDAQLIIIIIILQ